MFGFRDYLDPGVAWSDPGDFWVQGLFGGILEIFGSRHWLVGSRKSLGPGIGWCDLGDFWVQGLFDVIQEIFGCRVFG